MTDSPDVSVIIVNWNTRDVLLDCLRSVYEQTREIAFEVIVIDNASTDGSADTVRRAFPQAILIENVRNRGFAGANNQGMALSTGRYILLLNSDTVVLDHAIEKSVHFADQHSEAAVIGCRALNPDGTLQPTCFMYPSMLNMVLSASYLYKLFPKNRFFGREHMTWWDQDDIREVEVISGCFMLVRQQAVAQVGTFDEIFFMYAEETDWCYRFTKAGWKHLFFPDAQIIHLGGESSKNVEARMLIELRLSILKFCRKHYSPPVFSVCGLLTVLSLLVRIPYWKMRSLLPIGDRKRSNQFLQAYIAGIHHTRRFMRCRDRGRQQGYSVSPEK